jgi:Rrf2 family protein
MIKINKKVEYAMIALKHISQINQEHVTTAREICDIYSTPFDTMSKVMQILGKHQILKSTQGLKGGYQLSRPLADINYLELVEIIEGTTAAKDCIAQNCHLISTCNITKPILRLNEELEGFLKNLNMKRLLETPNNGQNI